MPYARCGRSGLKLPRLSLGLYQNFSDKDPFAGCLSVLCRAFDLGITHFDLANNYGSNSGAAESILGRVLRRELAAHRDELVITTKAGYDMWPGPYGEWGSRKYLLASLDQSLRRLGLEYVDVFYSHRFDPETPLEETMGALASAVHQGKALYVGISNYDAHASERAIGILRTLGVPCLVNQSSYSLLNRGIERELLPLLQREGVGAVTFQALQRGILSDAWAGDLTLLQRSRFQGWGMPQSWLSRIAPLAAHARSRGQTLSQMALAWCLRDERVCSVIVGARTPDQVTDSVAALAGAAFSAEELQHLDSLLSSNAIQP
jgi:L-glyceraldehyde 3-phosphate reductase